MSGTMAGRESRRQIRRQINIEKMERVPSLDPGRWRPSVADGDGDESSSLHDLGDIESRVSTIRHYKVAIGSEANMKSLDLGRRFDRLTDEPEA